MNKKNQQCLLLIEDDARRAYELQNLLEADSFKITHVRNVSIASKVIPDHSFVAILYSFGKNESSAISFFNYCRENCPQIPVIAISSSAEAEFGYQMAKTGATHLFYTKQIQSNIRDLVVNSKSGHLKRHFSKSTGNPIESIIGNSITIQSLKRDILKVAKSPSPVLILGESGVGKELVAKSIFANSKRKDMPYCINNAAGGNADLVDSRYFGHLKGSFTNADRDQPGLFQTAENGTLFIDEIGNMPLSTQQKLLRAIEYNQIEPVGSTTSIQVDVRILAATHKNLSKAIKKGVFQEDLYHRLSALVIEVPSLNERKEDIPILAEHFSHKICLEEEYELKIISPKVLDLLHDVDWKGGNIRMLSNFLRSAIIDAGRDSDVLLPENFSRILRERNKIAG